MPAYRLHCVDGGRRIIVTKRLAADDDYQALQFAKRIANEGVSAELWKREVLVGHFLVRPRGRLATAATRPVEAAPEEAQPALHSARQVHDG